MADADSAVADCPWGLVASVSGRSSLVVVGPTARTRRDRPERPLVDGVIAAPVAEVSGEHRPFLARGDVRGDVPASLL